MRWVKRLVGALCSPGALLVYAALLALPFLVAHAAGLREYTGVLSGTLPSAEVAPDVQVLLGLGYAAAFMVAVILAPVFALAAGVIFAGCLLPKRRVFSIFFLAVSSSGEFTPRRFEAGSKDL